MTDRPDQAAPDPAPRTPVTDLLGLLWTTPTAQVAQILEIGLDTEPRAPSQPWHLALQVTTPPAGQDLADRLGLTDPPTTEPRTCGTETRWAGEWAGQDVEVFHDSLWPPGSPRGPQHAQALTGHLARLDQALTALEDPTDLGEAAITAAGLRLQAHTTPAAKDLADHLVPHSPRGTVPGTGHHVPWDRWTATCPDTTITGPPTPTHHHTDADEDLP